MALKAFQREGLRRDKNLGDLLSPNTALNNILATPSMLGQNESFTIDDLAPIKNIYITNITASTFQTLKGITLEFTVIDPGPPAEIDNESNPLPFRPLVKIKNRLDTAYFSTGEPFFNGGDGPNAKYYDTQDVIRDAPTLQLDQEYGEDISPAQQIIRSGNNLYRTSDGATRSTASGQLTHTYGTEDGFTWVAEYDEWDPYLNPVINELTGDDESITDNFWERGQFIYGNKVQTSFVSLFGGVNWQGMFKPTESGDANFYLRTTGSTTFRFQHPLYPSYSTLKYGKVDVPWEDSNGIFSGTLDTYLTNLRTWLLDNSRKWIKVVCEDNVQLQTGDVIYLEIDEGPLQARQYSIYQGSDTNPSATPQDPSLVSGQTVFFVEATTDFNLNNVNYSSIPTVNDPSNTANGYDGTARYFPYERRPYKTYLNSVKHKITIDPSDFTATSNDGTTSYITINDEQLYQQMMIEDYIYDYRRRSSDTVEDEANPGTQIPAHGVRRYKITGLNDSNRTVSLEMTATYNNISLSDTNDQYGYVDQLSAQLKYSGTTAERIENIFNTGFLNDTIDTGTGAFGNPGDNLPNTPTETLYYVARYGESVARYKYFKIEQFLENAVDYAIDWIYWSKEEDISPTSTQKAWVLWYRSETAGDFGPLNYKFLYERDYKFYEIGDFKRFLDNSIMDSGTSREIGIDQRAFGKPKLIDKADQYNMLYSLLPIKSEYDPPVNWNSVAKSITATIPEGSRAIDVSDQSVIETGNYIVDNSSADAWIQGTNEFRHRGRVNEKLYGTGTIIGSQKATGSVTGRPVYILDHKGFVCTLKITGGSGNSWNFAGNGAEIQIGHVIVSPQFATQGSYVRIVKVDYNAGNETGTFILDTSVSLSADTLVAVYYDRGIDITKPLAAFCTDSGCGQHAYSGEVTDTQFIAISATNGSGGNESQLDAFINNNSGNVQTINNNNASIQWLLEPNMNDVDQTNYNNSMNNTFNNSVVKVMWDASLGARSSASEEGISSVANTTFLPIGWIKGLVKLTGSIWDGTSGGVQYYYIVKLGSRWQSNADNFTLPESSPGAGDANGLVRNRTFNPRSYSGSAWNVQSYRLQIQGGPSNYSNNGDITNTSGVTTAKNGNTTGFWRVTSSFNLTGTETGYFANLNSFAPDSPSTTYRLEAGNYIRNIGGDLWWFNDFNDFQDIHSVWANTDGSFNPTPSGDTGTTNGSGRVQQSIFLQAQEGPVKITGGSLSDNFKYFHYRRKQYEMVPMNTTVENKFNGHFRLINTNATEQTDLVWNTLQNGTNKLSVFTFANTTDNRELCCPPLDTSPPFDSSPIGLSTTALEPDMTIDGLVNVRSISGTHPIEKIFGISSTNLADIGTCPVNKKFEIMFGGTKYELLLANAPTPNDNSTLDKIIRGV